MEVDVAPADQDKEADYVLNIIAAKKSPTVAAVISGRPGSDKFAAYMNRHRDNPLIKGVRQVLHAGSAERGLCLQPQFVKSVQLLGEMGKSFDLCMRPTELANGASLAQKCPDTRFVVDHCGNADVAAWQPKEKQTTAPGHTVEQWKTDMGKLAKHPNVICKISGIVARAPKGWTPEHLAPVINFCLDEFGPDRVVFGGD
jgi:predicted TIM-barrel fold metal-dependent hydrolase